MRDSVGVRRVARFLLLALMALAIGTGITTSAQQKTAGPEPVKVSPLEAEKYVIYHKLTSSMTRHQPLPLPLRGTVTLAYTVNAVGDVVDIVAIAGDAKNVRTVNAAKDDVSRWQYKPYLVDGKATPMRTTITIAYGQQQ